MSPLSIAGNAGDLKPFRLRHSPLYSPTENAEGEFKTQRINDCIYMVSLLYIRSHIWLKIGKKSKWICPGILFCIYLRIVVYGPGRWKPKRVWLPAVARLRFIKRSVMKNKWIVPAIIIAIGLFLLGQRIEQGIIRSKEAVRTVSVKGLSEREVPADKVIWPLVYKEIGNDLQTIYRTVNAKNAIVIDFLKSNDIPESEISVAPPAIVDIQADRYGNQAVPYRYNVTSVITVSSNQVDKVRDLIVKQSSLLEKGVAIVTGDYQYNTQYLFTKLNELKPEMIAEATQNARIAAEKFAKDSDSKLGKISSAYQGQFSITDRDANTPYLKNVRVVTSVIYYLKN